MIIDYYLWLNRKMFITDINCMEGSLMAITLQDIADKADISKTTVSRVLNDKKSSIPISEDTRKKVMSIAKELGYRPNINARNLSTKRSYVLGFIVDDILDPFFNELIKGIEEYSRKQGYRLILSTIGSDSLEEVIDNLLNQSAVEGLILGATNQMVDDHKIIKSINKRGVPVTLLGHYYKDVPSICVNNYEGGYKATSYLINLGYKKISIITGPEKRNDSEERFRGYKKALKDNDILIRDNYIMEGNFSYESGYNQMKSLLSLKKLHQAVYECNDLMALGAISAANELNFKVKYMARKYEDEYYRLLEG